MIRPSKSTPAYLYSGVVDMCKSIDGLAGIIENELELNPLEPALFVFCNRGRDKIKILFWENNGFKTIQYAQAWVLKFVRWYNTEHRHSALNYVTPQQRHTGEADQILAQRKQVIEAEKAANPQRWSGNIRNLSLPDSVTLNPEKAVNC